MDNTYDSEYEVQLGILKKLGGDDTKKFDSPYEVQLEILEKVKEGGGGGLSAPFYTDTILPEEEGGPTGYEIGIKTDDDYSGAAFLYASSDNNSGIELLAPNTVAEMAANQENANLNLDTGQSSVTISSYTNGSFNINAYSNIEDIIHNFRVNTESILYRYANPYGYKEAYIYPDKIEFKLYDDGSGLQTYTLDSGTIVKANNALDKTTADTYYNPKNSATASTSGYKFPKWNNKGQITGTTATAYQATQKTNGTSRTIYSTSSSALPDIYAPTTAGTNGQYLRSNGSGAPTWANISIDPHIIDDAGAIVGDYTPAINAFYSECISKGYQANCYIKIVSYDAEGTSAESYYLPSSSRIYNGNVELWLFTTEDGNTWENIHYLITGESITRNVTTGTFGA